MVMVHSSPSATAEVENKQSQQLVEVGHYASLPQFHASILDTYIPRFQRLTQLHFGCIVSNPHAPMAFSEKMGYNMTFNLVPPGNGNALHMHKSIEVFVALDGCWEIAWGMHGEHKVLLNPWDLVAVPARVCHSYKNAEEDTAHNIMTILPGKSWIAWAPDVVGEARANGADCDENGVMRKFAKQQSSESIGSLAQSAEEVTWRHMGADEMSPYVHRFSDRLPMVTKVEHDGAECSCEMFWKTIPGKQSFAVPARSDIDVLIVILSGSVSVSDGKGDVSASAGKLDTIRVPKDALVAGQIVLQNILPEDVVCLITATHMRALNDLFFHLC